MKRPKHPAANRQWRWCARCEQNIDTSINHQHDEEPMAKKQTVMPGVDRKKSETEEQIEELHQRMLAERSEAKELKRKADQTEIEIVTVMRSHKIGKYAYRDQDGTGYELAVETEHELKQHKLPDAKEDDTSERKPKSPPQAENGVHPGLIAQAEKTDEADAS